MAFGGICGSLLGGYALTNVEIATIFLLFTVLPAVQLLSCGLIKENPLHKNDEKDHLEGNHLMNGNSSLIDEDSFTVKKLSKRTSRRKKSHKSRKKTDVASDRSRPFWEGDRLVLKWFRSLKNAIYGLYQAFQQPVIWRPMAWFFLAHVTVPNLSTVLFYYQTEFLKLEASFLGTSRVVGWVGLMIGTFIYNRFFKTMKLRKILLFAHVGLALLTTLDMILVSRINVSFGISDKVMVLSGSALADAINQLKFMPFLILSGQLCPPGIEGTLFALFMSINNFGSTLGSFVGAGLASFLNINSGSFDNLLLGIAIQVVCIFIPVALLFLIPKEATGISA